MLKLKIEVDAETYQHLVRDAVNSPRSIPEQAGLVLREAYGLPPRTGAAHMTTASGHQPLTAVTA